MAVLVVTGINCDGKRDVLAIEPMAEESAATYTQLFDNPKARGIKKVWLVVSDAHKGLVKAARESFALLTAAAGRPSMAIATTKAGPSTITSHYVEVVRCAATARASLRARRVYITNVDRTCRLLWPPPATGFTLRGSPQLQWPARSGSVPSASLRAGSSPLFFLPAGFPRRARAA